MSTEISRKLLFLNFFSFRNIKSFICQIFWEEFVIECPLLFNEIFKSCVKKFHVVLESYYDLIESKSAGDSGMMAPKSTLLKDFETLYSSMAFSDVELEVEGKTLKAHRLILSSI